MGYGQISCFGGLCETPNLDRLAANGLRYAQLPHDGALLADAHVPADRPQPPLERDGEHRRERRPASPATRRDPVRERLPLGDADAARLRGVRRRQVAPDAAHRDEHGGAARPLAAGPRLRALLRLHGRRHEPVAPRARATTTTRSSRRARPRRATTSPRTSPTARSSSSPTCKNVAPEKPFFLYFCTGAGARAAPRAEGVDREVPRQVRHGLGQGARRGVRAAEGDGHRPAGHAAAPSARTGSRSGTTLSADEKRLYARMMEVFAGFISHTDHHIGRVLDFLEQIGELDNTIIVAISDNGASAEGGPHGSLNEANFFNRVPETVEENLARIDELGGPHDVQPLPVRLDVGRQHAVPALEARGARGRRRRSVHRPLAGRHRRRSGEVRRPVRARRRRHADGARRARHRAAARDQGRHAVARSRARASRTRSTTRDAPSKHETQYYEMLGNRAIYHRGWKAVTYHGTEGMIYDGVTDPTKPFDEDVWELYHVEEDFSECRDLAAEYPEKLRELQDIWWIEAATNNVLPLDARSIGRGLGRPRLDDEPRKRFVYYPGGAPIEIGGRGEHEEPLAHDHGGSRDSAGRRRGRARRRRRPLRRLLAVRAGPQALLLVQLPRQGGMDVHVGHRRADWARARSDAGSRRRGRSRSARAACVRLYINGRRAARDRSRARCRSCSASATASRSAATRAIR